MAYTEYHRRQNAQAGYDAFMAGKPDTANPKPHGTIMRDDWCDGWNAAFNERTPVSDGKSGQ